MMHIWVYMSIYELMRLRNSEWVEAPNSILKWPCQLVKRPSLTNPKRYQAMLYAFFSPVFVNTLDQGAVEGLPQPWWDLSEKMRKAVSRCFILHYVWCQLFSTQILIRTIILLYFVGNIHVWSTSLTSLQNMFKLRPGDGRKSCWTSRQNSEWDKMHGCFI